MTIRQQGGVFGRNPSFNDVDATQLDLSGNAIVGGTLGVTGAASLSTASINALSTATALNVNSNNTPYGLDIGFLHNNSRIGSAGSAAGIDGTRSLTDFGLHGINNIDLCVGYTRIGSVTSSGIALANGKGIDFSATSGTGTSELFDDYEEGTWTPTTAGDATGALNGQQAGTYTKIGRFVHVQFQIDVSTNFTSSKIGGLPYQPAIQSTISSLYGIVPVMSSSGSIFAGVSDLDTNVALFSDQVGTAHNPNTTSNIYRVALSYATA